MQPNRTFTAGPLDLNCPVPVVPDDVISTPRLQARQHKEKVAGQLLHRVPATTTHPLAAARRRPPPPPSKRAIEVPQLHSRARAFRCLDQVCIVMYWMLAVLYTSWYDCYTFRWVDRVCTFTYLLPSWRDTLSSPLSNVAATVSGDIVDTFFPSMLKIKSPTATSEPLGAFPPENPCTRSPLSSPRSCTTMPSVFPGEGLATVVKIGVGNGRTG